MMDDIQKELNDFLDELYTNELKKRVLPARANGESLEQVGMKLGVTMEFVRQVEARIARKFAMTQSGRKILKSVIALCSSGAVQSPTDLKTYFGEHTAELVYLLRLYKNSYFYNGEQQIERLF